MRVLAKRLGRETHLGDHRQRQPRSVIVVLANVVDAHGLNQNLPHGKARVQAGIRILKNNLDAAAVGPHLRGAELRQINAFKQDAAGGRSRQARQHHAHCGFARA